MESKVWDIAELTNLGRGYWVASIFHAGLKTGIIAELTKGPAASQDLAARLSLDPRSCALLLEAMQALDLVEAAPGQYSLHPQLRDLLSPEHPDSVYHYCMHIAYNSQAWSRLDEVVADGKPIPRPPAPADGSPAPGEVAFYLGMRDLGRLASPGLAGRLGLKSGMHLLDLGGGPGVYAHTMAAETPGLKVTVLDLAQAEPYFQDTAKGHPAAGQVDFKVGDYHADDLGGPYDAVWMSHILHSMNSERCAELTAKAAGALKPGGRLWVQDFVLGAEGSAGRFASIFALNMLINTQGGRTFSFEEIAGFMAKAGLTQVEDMGRIRPQSDGWIIGAVKPE